MADQTPPHHPHDGAPESLWLRLLWIILIAMMLGLVQTVLQLAALVQFILMVTRNGRPNVEIAWFGKRLGD